MTSISNLHGPVYHSRNGSQAVRSVGSYKTSTPFTALEEKPSFRNRVGRIIFLLFLSLQLISVASAQPGVRHQNPSEKVLIDGATRCL